MAETNIMEAPLSRLIQTETVGKERERLTRMIVIAIRELMNQTSPDSNTKDIGAFISIALIAVHKTVERTVAPWEKRNYWVKADRFRINWAWAEIMGENMKEALLVDNWSEVAILTGQIGEKLSNIKVSPRHRMGKPWVGAWKQLIKPN